MAALLIADDEKNILSGLKLAFEDEGYDVITASDGKEAWDKLQKNIVDLVITDLRMPEMDGYELLKRIASSYPTLPVIVLTGHGTIETAVETMRDGAVDFFTKPVDIDKLSLVVKKSIKASELQEQNRKLSEELKKLRKVLSIHLTTFSNFEPVDSKDKICQLENKEILQRFVSSKKLEGCSEKTLRYYSTTIQKMLTELNQPICDIQTDDLRNYLSDYQTIHQNSRVTIDNIRRIFSSFFAWLEDENYIVKSPVRRIHKVKVGKTVKEIYSDEALEIMRDHAGSSRDLAMIDLLASTGMRVGELVKLNKSDIDFQNRECIVTGKGDKQRKVYFDARTKIHLQNYLSGRTDNNEALFVSLLAPFERLLISGVEIRLRKLGRTLNIPKVHPHKFRRTLATMAIDKGMPIEQVQHLLGHQSLDTTLQYAMVNQNNVKLSHRKYLG